MQRRNHHHPFFASGEKQGSCAVLAKESDRRLFPPPRVCSHGIFSVAHVDGSQDRAAAGQGVLRFSPLPKGPSNFPFSAEFPVLLAASSSAPVIISSLEEGRTQGRGGGGRKDELRVRGAAGVDPIELRFPFQLNKQISCSLQLTNKTDEQVAFKVKTTSPKKYCVRPNNGIVPPRSTADVLVTMQTQREAPPDMQCKDKFLVQSAIVGKDVTPKDITGEMFTKESGNLVDEVKLKVVYVTPSSITEGSEDGSPGSLSYQEIAKCDTLSLDMLLFVYLQPFVLISKLMDERNSAMEQNKKLREELDFLRRGISGQHGGFSLVFVLLIAILGILLGFIMKR
ncbi:hypothetical protein PR202_ga02138 [Eleusine coracana subsp. coracana]|uniref:MSP domain-containing protein n=1 Tax=Eleusine coracana subsp. coracana TaxID=191504 RepID=A0AAV5BIX8_ELECO|nr:hypothetical protein PR202_ga01451 [Eleusine coracana subsp. coracana]GJM86293.1 hypothetical protein PR202_ga02138 [Eleusine coracana subsp. coracana]